MTDSILYPDGGTTINAFNGEFGVGDILAPNTGGTLVQDSADEVDGFTGGGTPSASDYVYRSAGLGNGTSGIYYLMTIPTNGYGAINVGTTTIWARVQLDYPSQDDEATYYITVFDGVQGTALTNRLTLIGPAGPISTDTIVTEQFTMTAAGEALDWADHQLHVRMEVQTQRIMSADGTSPAAYVDAIEIQIRDVAIPAIVIPPAASLEFTAYAPNYEEITPNVDITVPEAALEFTSYPPRVWPITVPAAQLDFVSYAPGPAYIIDIPATTLDFTSYAPEFIERNVYVFDAPETIDTSSVFGAYWISIFNIPVTWPYVDRAGETSLASNYFYASGQSTTFFRYNHGGYIDPTLDETRLWNIVRDETTESLIYLPYESGVGQGIIQDPLYSDYGTNGGDGVEPYIFQLLEHYELPLGAGNDNWRYFIYYGRTTNANAPLTVDLGDDTNVPPLYPGSLRWKFPSFFYGRDVPNGEGYLFGQLAGEAYLYEWTGGHTWDTGTVILDSGDIAGLSAVTPLGWCRADQTNPDKYYAVMYATAGGTNHFVVVAVDLTNIAGYTVVIDDSTAGLWGSSQWYAATGDTPGLYTNEEERCWPIDRPGLGKYYYFRTQSAGGSRKYTRLFLNDANWLAPTFDSQSWGVNEVNLNDGPLAASLWELDTTFGGQNTGDHMGIVWDRRSPEGKVFGVYVRCYHDEVSALNQMWNIFCWRDLDDPNSKWSNWKPVFGRYTHDSYYIERNRGGIRGWGQDNDGLPSPLWIYQGTWSGSATNYQQFVGIKWWVDGTKYKQDVGIYVDTGRDKFISVQVDYNPSVNVDLGSLNITPLEQGRKAFQFDGLYDLQEAVSAVDASVTVDGAYMLIYDDENPNLLVPIRIDGATVSVSAVVDTIQIRQLNMNYRYFGQQWSDDMLVFINAHRANNSLPPLTDIVALGTDRYTINQKSVDVSSIWAEDMEENDLPAFNSLLFTPGYQTTSERAAQMNSASALGLYDVQEVSTGTGFTVNGDNFPTASELWNLPSLGWGDSSFDPLWLYDFGVGKTELYLELGMSVGPRTGSSEENSIYFSIYMLDYTDHPYTSGGGTSNNWRYDDTQSSDPNESDIRFNTASFDTVTTIWLDKLDIGLNDRSLFIDTWGPQDKLVASLFGDEAARFGQYTIVSVTKVSDSYYTIVVTLDSHLGAFFSDNDVVVLGHIPYDPGPGGATIEPTPVDGIRFLDLVYWVTGTSWNSEFNTLVNDLRATFNLPPFLDPDVSFYVRHVPSNKPNYTDIATVHSVNLMDAQYFDHEDYTETYLPPAEALLSRRMALIGRETSSENILLWSASPYFDPENPGNFVSYGEILNDTTHITPLQAYTGWYNSPPHYANMLRDWGDAEVYSLVGTESRWYPPSTAFYDNYHGGVNIHVTGWTHAITNNFIDATTEMAYRVFNTNYQIDGAVIEVLYESYDLIALADVKSDHTIGYSIKVSYGHGLVYGSRVTYAHTIPTYYSIGAAHSLIWSGTSPVSSDQSIVYKIDEGTYVASDHSLDYSIRVQKAHRVSYAPLLQAIAKHRIVYADYTRVISDQDITWSVQGRAVSAQTLKWSSSVNVIADQVIKYDLSATNRVYADQSILYTIAGESRTEALAATTLRVNGVSIQINDLVLTQDEGSPAWFGRARIASLDDFALVKENDPAVLSIGAEQWNMVLTEKSFNRAFGSLDMQVKMESPVTALMSPRATTGTYRYEAATAARTIVEEILRQAVDWQILSWTVPANRFAVDDSTPYDAALTLIAAAGGIMQSARDGTIIVRYFYPVAMNQLANVTPNHIFTDVEDNLSAINSFEYRTGMNRVRILEGDSTFRDVLEWEEDEIDPSRGVLKAFLSPWRTGYNLVYTDSDGPVVRFPRGTKQETITDIVEFTEGAASTKSPIYSLTSVSWLSDELSSVVFEQYSNSLTAGTGVNQGYGLAEVTYVTQYDEYYVIGKLGLSAQFLIEDEE